MKKLLCTLSIMLLLTGCIGQRTQLNTSDIEAQISKSGLDIDADNNNATDIAYGGTNATTASAARTNLGLAIGTDVSAHTHTHTGTYEPADATILKDADINVTVQGYDADLANLATPTAWRIFYSNGSSVVSELAFGTAGTALVSGGASVAPTWEAVAGSGGGTIGGTLGSTDNVLVRSDGTGGVTAQGSLVTLSDVGSINIPTGQTYNINGSAHTHNYQPANANLTSYATVAPSANALSMLSLTYANMLTALGGQPVDADLTALAGLSGVRGDVIYRDASQWQRLAKGTSGTVLKMGASDPYWGTDNNDGGTGISRWDQLGAPTTDLSLNMGITKSVFSSSLNSADAVWSISSTTNPFTYATSLFDLKFSANGDSNGFFMRGYDNSSDLKWSIGPEGAFTGYSFETRQAATGGKLQLLEGAANGTNYVEFVSPDSLASNYTYTLPAVTGTMALEPDYTISATTGQTYTLPATSSTIASVTAPIALASQAAGDLFYATSATAYCASTQGTSGQLLAQKADLTGPEWIAAPAGTGDFKADGTVPMTGSLVGTVPGASNLGSASAELGDIFIGDGKAIKGQADQSATLTSGAGKFTANAFTVTNALTAGTINGHTFTTGSSTFTGTAGQTYTFPTTTATLARTDAANTFTGHQTIEGVTSTGATGTGKLVFDGTPTLVTPALGEATATSVLATGILDGTAPVTITSGDTANIGATYKSGYIFNNNATPSNATTYTLPTAALGKQYCVKNIYGSSGALRVNTSAAGQYISLDGDMTASGGYVISDGAAADGACFVGLGGTHWEGYAQKGTWTAN